MADSVVAGSVAAPSTGALARLSLVGLAVGVAAGAGAALFVAVEHELTHLLWHTLPDRLGYASAPLWLIVVLPIMGGLLTFAAMQLPGQGGHSPLEGFKLNIGPKEVGSVVLAALASLSFGAVLGPEAPLMAVGTAVGALIVRSPSNPARQVMMLVGAMAAVGAVFGNPLVTGVLLLEIAVAAGGQLAQSAVLIPALAGLGGGYLLQVGVGRWTGLGAVRLAQPGMPSYQTVAPADLVTCVALAAIVAVVALLARRGGEWVAALGTRAPLATLLAAGALTGTVGLIVVALTGSSYELVLFAGQSAVPSYLTMGSLWVALTVLLAKLVGYAVCLGGGFRGGPVFPAIALGTILASIAANVMSAAAISAFSAAAIAAATAAMLKMPFTAVLLGAVLTASAGPATTVLAIVGAVVGVLVRLGADAHHARR